MSSDGFRTPRLSTLSGYHFRKNIEPKITVCSKKKILLFAINKISSGSLRFVLDSVGKLHGVPYFLVLKPVNILCLF